MKKYKIIVLSSVIFICIIAAVLIFVLSNKEKENKLISLEEVKKDFNLEIEACKQGKYSNLIFKDFTNNVEKIESVYNITIEENKIPYENDYKQNLQLVQNCIYNFFGDEFDTSVIEVSYNGLTKKYANFVEEVENDTYFGNEWYVLFGDTREYDEDTQELKRSDGFLQVDPYFSIVWFSRGETDETSPLSTYDVKKVYNFVESDNGLNDKYVLKNGEITIKEAVSYVDNFLNQNLPFEKNEAYLFQVVEVRVLDMDGQDILGFKVRKTYNGIPFDYCDAITIGQYTSEHMMERGDVTMVNVDEIENFSGLGYTNDVVKNEGEKLNNILPVSEAIRLVSEKIGTNSVYEVYGIEMIYQVDDSSEEEVVTYPLTGKPMWKIITRNKNDDKITWFYVDVITGEVSHLFAYLYEENN